MSAFYDQASLVVVPSGYKSGKIYAQKPLTTDGQLTFTRASTATRVNASGLIETVSSGVPRLDYLNSTCPRLLLEPQRTNVALYSEQMDNAAWSKDELTVTANATISPDGYQNADKIVENTVNGIHRIREAGRVSTIGTVFTASCFFKASERSKVLVGITDLTTGEASATFDLSNGTGVNSSSGSWTNTSFTITNYGNGWYRCTVTGTQGAGVGSRLDIYISNGSTISYAGTNGFGLFMFGAQIESSSAYATSYIPTLSTSVTRVADAAEKTGISSLIGQTEGTIYWEVSNVFQNSGNGARLFLYADGSNFILISPYGTILRVLILSSGTAFDNFISISGTSLKIAVAYKANDYKFYVNGVSVGTPAATSVPAMSAIGFLDEATGGSVTSQSETSQALIFKTRLTNAQLAELTTL